MAGGFNANTRQFIRKQPNLSFTAVSTTQSADLPQVGYLAQIYLKCVLTLGANSGATVATYVGGKPPYSFIKRVRLSTNEGADIYNSSGWMNYQLMRTLRTGFDPATEYSENHVGSVTHPFTRYFVALDTSSTSFRWMHLLPISWGEANLTGLVLLQNTGVRFTLQVDCGQLSDVFSVVGTSTFSSLAITPELHFFSLPADPQDSPDLAFVRQMIEDNVAWTNNGDVVYKPRLGNIYTRVIQQWENNNLPLGGDKVNNWRFSYAQAQQVYDIDPDIQLFRQRRRYGQDLSEGVYAWDWQMGNGWPELPSSRDVIDTSRLTDMQLLTNIDSTVSPTSANLRTLSDMLVPVRG